MSSQQKALVVLEPKGQYTLVNDSPVPQPQAGEILVKLQAVALNHLEWKLPFGPVMFPYPLHSGTDGAGTVVGLGEGVTRVKDGDRVLFHGWFDEEHSTFQEYAVVDENLCAKVPETIDSLQAASIPGALITASFGLCLPTKAMPTPSRAAKDLKFPPRGGAGLTPYWQGDLGSSPYGKESIIVLGGSSSVGQYAIQVAKLLGFKNIITTASEKHTVHLKSLGATSVVDRNSDFKKEECRVKQHFVSGSKIKAKVIFDAVGSGVTQEHIDLLVPDGRFVTVGMAVPSSLKFEEDQESAVIFGAGQYYSKEAKGIFGNLEEFLRDGTLKPLNVEKIEGGLNGIPNGLRRLKEGQASGYKLVVDINETA